MRVSRKFISGVILFCFIFNIAVSDYAIGQQGNYYESIEKLAVASIFSPLKGVEHQDIGKVKLLLEAQLMKAAGKDNIVTSDKVKKRSEEIAKASASNSIFKAPVHFFIHETTDLGENYFYVKCRVENRTYYAVFPKTKDHDSGFPVEVYTKAEWEKTVKVGRGQERDVAQFIAETNIVPRRKTVKPEDAKAIERYIDHEKQSEELKSKGVPAVDEYIRKKMEAGEYAVSLGNAQAVGLYKDTARFVCNRSYVLQSIADLGAKLSGVGFGAASLKSLAKKMVDKNIVIIYRKKGERLPQLTVMREDGKTSMTVQVRSHSSDNAIYIVVDEDMFGSMTKAGSMQDARPGARIAVDPSKGSEALREEIGKRLFDEASAHLGLPGTVDERGNLSNILTSARDQYEKAVAESQPYEASNDFRRLMPLKSLSRSSVVRDYASPERVEAPVVLSEGRGATAANGETVGVSLKKSGLVKVYNIGVEAQEVATLQSTKDEQARLGVVRAIFRRVFGKVHEVIVRANGRDNAQGEHVDYPDMQFASGQVHLFSMGSTIQNNYLAAVRRRDDSVVRMAHADTGEMIELDMGYIRTLQALSKNEREFKVAQDQRMLPAWAIHTMGLLMQAIERGLITNRGADILLTSNVPYGAGLSNSAANCVAVAMALNELYAWNLQPEAIVSLARDGERDSFVGSTCGWLDQLLIVFSKKGFFAMIDYATRAITYFKSQLPTNLQRVLINTNIPRNLTDTEYSDRSSAELPTAIATLRKILPERDIQGSTSLSLAEINRLIRIFDSRAPEVDFANRKLLLGKGLVNGEDLMVIDRDMLPGSLTLWYRFQELHYYNKPVIKQAGRDVVLARHVNLSDAQSFALCLRRMRHQLTSGIRTPLTGRAAEKGDVVSFGELISAEGRSLRMNGDYQITGDNGAQDALLDIGVNTGRELGIRVWGRMEGGGGGGNVGFYIDRSNNELYLRWQEKVVKKYHDWVEGRNALRGIGIEATIIEPEMSGGAEVVESIAVEGRGSAAEGRALAAGNGRALDLTGSHDSGYYGAAGAEGRAATAGNGEAAAEADVSVKDLSLMTKVLERDVIEMIFKAGSGHPGGSLSMLKMIAALYFGRDNSNRPLMHYDPKDPKWENRDRFVLSKGHAAPGLYAALGRAGFFPAEEFAQLRKLGSDLQGHTDMTKTPGVDMSAGSLGVGFSAAIGMALAAKMDGRSYTTYSMLGDGEAQEGQVDEAARWAASMKLDNMIAMLDWNGMQIDGKVTETDLDYDGQVALWKARGWNVVQANGEDMTAAITALRVAQVRNGKPTIIIARTIKGSGLKGMDKHGAAPKQADVEAALKQIEQDIQSIVGQDGHFDRDAFIARMGQIAASSGSERQAIDAANGRQVAQQSHARETALVAEGSPYSKIAVGVRAAYPPEKKVSTRAANGDELAMFGSDERVVVMSADLKESVMFGKFAEAFGSYSPANTRGRYVPAGIREAHMVSMAAGLAACGKIPVIGTFSIFTTRMVDQLNAILNTSLPVIIVGTHGGLATGPDGRTHQDAHSLGVLGALPGVRTYEGADAEEERVLSRHIYDVASKQGGIHYIRPARLDTPIIKKPDGWQEGARRGFYVLYDSEAAKGAKTERYDVTIVASGVTAVDAVAAAEELAREGKIVKVVNVTQLKALVDPALRKAFAGEAIGKSDHVISVIDSLPEILADKVNHALIQEKVYPESVTALGIKSFGESGTPAELYALHGFDKAGIISAANAVLHGSGNAATEGRGATAGNGEEAASAAAVQSMPKEAAEIRMLIEKSRREGIGEIMISIKKGDKALYADSRTGSFRVLDLTQPRTDIEDYYMKAHVAAFQADSNTNVVVQARPVTACKMMANGEALPPLTPDFVALLQETKSLAPAGIHDVFISGRTSNDLRARPKQDMKAGSTVVELVGHSAIMISEADGVITAGTNVMEAYYRLRIVEDTAKTYIAAKSMTSASQTVRGISEFQAMKLLVSPFEIRRARMMAGGAADETEKEEELETVQLTYDQAEVARVREQLLATGKRVAEEGLVVGPGGNISAVVNGRTATGENVKIMLIKASGKSFESMTAEDYIGVTVEKGRMRRVEGLAPLSLKPSTEVHSHAAIYKARPDVSAVVHAHSPIATGIATAGWSFTLRNADIPVIPYVHPGEGEMPAQVGRRIENRNALLIANHGAFTVGADLDEALKLTLEMEAKANDIAKRDEPAEGRGATAGNGESASPTNVVDLKATAGIPLSLNTTTGEIVLGDNVVSEPKWERPLKDAGNSIANPAVIADNPNRVVYYGYRNVRLSNDTASVDRLKLRFDITVLQPGLIGEEYVMTKGHIHPGTNYPEFYEVWNGTAIYIQQGVNSKTGRFEVIATLARPGDKVLLIPGYYHRTVNIGDEPLVMANWICDEVGGKEDNVPAVVKPDFSEIEAKNGYAYHVVRSADGRVTFRHNPKYGKRPADLRFAIPAASVNVNGLELSHNMPMYGVLGGRTAEAISVFLRNPAGFEPLFTEAFEFVAEPIFNLNVTAAGVGSEGRGATSGNGEDSYRKDAAELIGILTPETVTMVQIQRLETLRAAAQAAHDRTTARTINAAIRVYKGPAQRRERVEYAASLYRNAAQASVESGAGTAEAYLARVRENRDRDFDFAGSVNRDGAVDYVAGRISLNEAVQRVYRHMDAAWGHKPISELLVTLRVGYARNLNNAALQVLFNDISAAHLYEAHFEEGRGATAGNGEAASGGKIMIDLRSPVQETRQAAAAQFRSAYAGQAAELDAHFAALPIDGKRLLQAAKAAGKPAMACNIDNGELSSLQIRSMMEAALEVDAYIIFEVGPGALKTYADGKPQLPEYCARVARELYQKTGRMVVYAVHLDHNQVDLNKFKKQPQQALQEAIDRAKRAIKDGFTSFATDTSTLTDEDVKREGFEGDDEYLHARLHNVIDTGIAILRVVYEEAKALGIVVGNEGEVGDVGKDISTFDEARYYYNKIREGLIAAGVEVERVPWMDVIAAQLGTSHGYDFTENDKLKPYEGGTISVDEYYGVDAETGQRDPKKAKKGVVVDRARELAERFKREMGIDIGVALHGFSGTPFEVAPHFLGTGIAKVNINTDWQAITWKVLQAYFPDLYRRCFDLSHKAAVAALDKMKGQLEGEGDAGKRAALQKKIAKLHTLVELPFEQSRNRIIFGKDGAPGLRTLFRGKEGWALMGEIVQTLQRTDVRMVIPQEQRPEDMLSVMLTCAPCEADDGRGLTALEAIHKLTKDRTVNLMRALSLDGSGSKVPATERDKELRLQEWQLQDLARLASDAGNEGRAATAGNGEAAITNLPSPRSVQGYNVWTLSDEAGNEFKITDFGANVLSMKLGGQEMLWHKTNGETVRQDNGLAVSGGMPFMFPWTSRIEEGMLNLIDGRKIDLKAFPYIRPVDGVTPDIKHVLHGMTDKIQWNVVKGGRDNITLSVRTRDVKIGVAGIETLAEVFGDVEVRLNYRLENGRFNSSVEVSNLSADKEAVMSFGFHPFYKLGDTLEGWSAQIPADEYWEADKSQVPLKQGPLSVGGTDYDLRSPKPLIRPFEIGLTTLHPGEDGNIVSKFMHTDGRVIEIVQSALFKNIMFWVPLGSTTLPAGIASIQPTTSSANAINMENDGIAEANPVKIAPGQKAEASWGIGFVAGEGRGATAASGEAKSPTRPAATDTVSRMVDMATEVGVDIAPPVAEQTLFVPYSFYKNDEEYAKDKGEYADRFGLVRIGTDKTDKVIPWVLRTISENSLDPNNVVVQLPAQFSSTKFKDQLMQLKSMNIKFIIINTQGMNNTKDKGELSAYRQNILQIMRLVRKIDKDTPESSKLYMLLRFYIEGHLSNTLEGKVAVDNCMKAIMANDVDHLLTSILSYKPIGKVTLPDYKLVTQALRSA